MQLQIEWTPQNTQENQVILDLNKSRFNNQCRKVYLLLMAGHHLTTTEALKFGIGDLRARVRDLIKAGIPVQKRLIENRYKEYYL